MTNKSLFILNAVLAFAVTFFLVTAYKAHASDVTTFYGQTTYYQTSLNSGDTINVVSTVNIALGCNSTPNWGRLNFFDGTATTTIDQFGGSGITRSCGGTLIHSYTASSPVTIAYQLESNSGSNVHSILAEIITPSSGGGGSNCNAYYPEWMGCIVAVDNPIQTIFNGFIIFMLVFFGVVWFFKRPKT